MLKRVLIFYSFVFLVLTRSFAFSARDRVHAYGFSALGDAVSGMSHNPATLYNLLRSLSEFEISADREFHYASFYAGFYLFRSPLLSPGHYTSFNLGLGLDHADEKNYLVSLGGTLMDPFKYGFTYKYVKAGGMEYSDLDMGFLAVLNSWLRLGMGLKNIRNKEAVPCGLNAGLALKAHMDIRFTSGLFVRKGSAGLEDYSFALDVNLIRNFFLLAGLQKDEVTAGTGLQFDYDRENVYFTLVVSRGEKKISRYLLSYNHKFANPFYSPGVPKEGKKEAGKGAAANEKILEEQRFYMNKARLYFAEERLNDTKEMLEKVLRLGKETAPAREAEEMLKKIRVIEKKLNE